MGAAVGLRGDYAAGQLRGLAKRSVDAAQTRRLLALAAIYEGGSRTEAAKIGGVRLQTVRDWVLAFNAEGPGGLINGKAPGNASLLDDEQRQALARIVESGPIPAAHDQRTRSAYIFGAICPVRGTAAGLVLPRCNTAAMALHLAEISQAVEPGCHAVLLLDQAGWHLSDKLAIPDNITLMPLPAKSPELNPTENIWQFMRDNWLSNRIFQSYEDILDHCCHAWNKLVDQPWTIMSIGMRDWAHRS